jgi:hypothetical protein
MFGSMLGAMIWQNSSSVMEPEPSNIFFAHASCHFDVSLNIFTRPDFDQ